MFFYPKSFNLINQAIETKEQYLKRLIPLVIERFQNLGIED